MALDINRIKAICFDVDGTLSDTDDLWVQNFCNILNPFSFVFPQKRARALARWGVMVTESPANMVYHLLDKFDLDDDLARLYNFLAHRGVEGRPSKFWLIPMVRDMLAVLSEQFPMSVVSARGSTTHQFLEQFDLHPFFKSVVISDTCRFTKPYPDPVIWAAKQMGVAPEACLMVGDTTVDIKAGKSAGAQTVGVLCGFGQEKELRRAGADLVLSSTADLLSVFTDLAVTEMQTLK